MSRSAKRHGIFSGALIVVGMRWTDRLVGLLSTLILARLLVPADFGVVAMASIVVGLVDVLLDLGVNVALIHNRDATKEDFDTAWTIRILQATLAGSLIFLAAPFAADYYHDPRVTDVMRVMALSVFVGGLENIGVVTFQKNMQFGKDFQFFFFKRLTGFIVTLAIAFWLRSYWAMVLGSLAARMTGVVLSYLMHSLRPRLTLSRFRELWSFSQWVLVRNIGGYADTRLDKFIVGGRADAGTMGGYTLADEVASIPTSELLAPLGRVLFPAFVDARHDLARLSQTFLLALGVQTLIVVPAGTGIALVAENLVMTLLGAKWSIAIPFIKIIALLQIVLVLSHAASYLLLSLGKVKVLSLFTWAQVIVFGTLAMSVFRSADASQIAWLRFSITACGLLVFIALVVRTVPMLRARDFLSTIIRPALASLAMTAALLALDTSALAHPLALSVQVATGAGVYAVIVVALWRLSGCPAGAETYLLEKAGRLEQLKRWLYVRPHDPEIRP
ncbi:MAG: lipopolysaccharide biosynthesis protein [Rhodocyclaceae bacterium]|nr:lipopolysaccharide biosynthesis protein [Rhodocyclaceae bacterium]MCB1961560.1 lipopolysaccharide biosynthesis protein [Rhodocyclaceae bacterium]